jgi:hypothetical protein
MKLNRNRLRRLIKEEYNKVLKEMYMGGGRGQMHRPEANMDRMSDNHPDFEDVTECIVTVNRGTMNGMHNSREDIEAACHQQCAGRNVSQHVNYCIDKCCNMGRMLGIPGC